MKTLTGNEPSTELTIAQHINIQMMVAVVSNKEMMTEVERLASEGDRPAVLARMASRYTNALISEMNRFQAPKDTNFGGIEGILNAMG